MIKLPQKKLTNLKNCRKKHRYNKEKINIKKGTDMKVSSVKC